MKTIFKSIAMALLLLASTGLMAQEMGEKAAEAEKVKAPATDAQNSAWEKYMAVGEMHKLLASADGDWKAEMTMWSAPGTEPSKSTSSCRYEMILGGRFQESRVEGTVMGMPFEGRGLVGYDNLKKVFTSTWVDNMGTGIMYSEGPYDAKTKSITFKGTSMDPMTGKEVKTREVYTMTDEANHTFEMYSMLPTGKEFKTLEIHYRR